MLQIGDMPIHASRFATSALVSLLRRLIPDEKFAPDHVDKQFIFPAFDVVATLQHIDDSEKDSSED
jgi:hypothetical protein